MAVKSDLVLEVTITDQNQLGGEFWVEGTYLGGKVARPLSPEDCVYFRDILSNEGIEEVFCDIIGPSGQVLCD